MPKKMSESVKLNMPLYKGQDYTGQKFGEWEVVGFGSYIPTKTGGRYTWQCRCSCGIEKLVGTTSLLYGATTKCLTCANRDRRASGEGNPNWKGYKHIPGTVLQKIRMSVVKRSKSRNLPVTITCEDLYNKWEEQGGKCIYTGRPLSLDDGASVDRIDSSDGYTPENIQWVHVDANRAKWELSHEEFLTLCKEVCVNQLTLQP